MKSLISLVLSAFLLAGCGMDYIGEPAGAKMRLTAQLSGDSNAKGSLSAAYSTATHILQWQLSYDGLSGPVTWAFLDGPDGTGAPAEIVPINLPRAQSARARRPSRRSRPTTCWPAAGQ